MQDQHKLIRGYRDLTQGEIDAMNEVKAAEADLGRLHQRIAGMAGVDKRWGDIARTHLEQGFMALVRSIARPEDRF